MRDVIEVFETTQKRVTGFRFRMLKAGVPDPIWVSTGLYPTAELAGETADRVNRLMFQGEYERSDGE